MLRITAGEFKGRALKTPPHEGTRPTQAKLRQALFNSLQTLIPNAIVLDLFAGSGALGFEALSRGAESVVFVESARQAAKLIGENAATLGVRDRVRLVSEPVERVLNRLPELGPFDVILADPPYEGGWEEKLLAQLPWRAALRPDGIFCLEWGIQKSKVRELPDETQFLVKAREKNYGDSVLTTYRLRSEASESGEPST